MITHEAYTPPNKLTGKEKHLSPLYYHNHPVANLRLSQAYDRGMRAAARIVAMALLWVLVLVSLVVLGSRKAHGQNIVPAFNSSGINGVLNTDLYGQGADWTQRILLASSKAPASINTELQINTAGAALNTPLTLPANRLLHLRQNISVAAAINLSANGYVLCDPGVSITVTSAIPALFLANQVNNLSVSGCTIHGSSLNTSAYTFQTLGVVNHVALSKNIVDGMGLINTQPGVSMTDLLLDTNTDTFASNTNSTVGAYLFFVVGARIQGNLFVHTVHGVQWWGGDAGDFTLSTGLAGKMTISHNRCEGVNQACIWGSKGSDITVADNQSDGNGDVAFDAEGGVRNSFTGNVAKNCGNGCFAWFYAAQDLSFVGNIAEGSVASAFFGKNASVDPSKQNGIDVRANTITCAPYCNAILFDALSNLHFDGNALTNARVLPVSYCAILCSISRNSITYNSVLPSGTNIVGGPGMLGGGTLSIEGNDIRSLVTQTASVAAIAGGNNDFNASDFGFIKGNYLWNWPVGIATSSSGTNPGVRNFWKLDGNTINATTAMVHAATTSNELYRVLPNNVDFSGAALSAFVNIDQIATANSCTTAATVGAQCTTTVAFPNPAPVNFFVTCNVYAATGVPAPVNYSNVLTDKKTFSVTIQATTAAAASGVIACKQQSQS